MTSALIVDKICQPSWLKCFRSALHAGEFVRIGSPYPNAPDILPASASCRLLAPIPFKDWARNHEQCPLRLPEL